jgi:hypothetical protein
MSTRGTLSTISPTWAGVEIAVAIRADRRDQRDLRRQIDEIAREQFEIGVDRAKLDLAAEQHPGDPRGLRAGIREIEPLRDAAVEQVEMFGEDDARLHHVQIMHLRRIDRGECAGEHVRLFLIVAFQADAVAGVEDRLEEGRQVGGGDELALREAAARFDPRRPCGLFAVPVAHRPIVSKHCFECDPCIGYCG